MINENADLDSIRVEYQFRFITIFGSSGRNLNILMLDK